MQLHKNGKNCRAKILTVYIWVKSLRQGPSGGRSSGLSTNSSIVFMVQVPRLVAQITPALRYWTPLHRPPAHPSPFAVRIIVPVTAQKKNERI